MIYIIGIAMTYVNALMNRGGIALSKARNALVEAHDN